jgi:hypothetical protein
MKTSPVIYLMPAGRIQLFRRNTIVPITPRMKVISAPQVCCTDLFFQMNRYPLNRSPNLMVLIETNKYLHIVFFTSNWEFNEIDFHLDSPTKSTNCFPL